MSTCFGFVTYNSYGNFEWTKICVSSFRGIFPKEKLLVVDHNHNPQELDYLQSQKAEVIPNFIDKKSLPPDSIRRSNTHGMGLDILVQEARTRGFERIVFIEPDCFFTSNVWYKELNAAIDEGNHMAGVIQFPCNQIHPCGSIWLIDSIPYSFEHAHKGEEVFTPEFLKILNYPELCKRTIRYPKAARFTSFWWDVGIKNWYFLALRGLAKKVSDEGFMHFWHGSKTPPEGKGISKDKLTIRLL